LAGRIGYIELPSFTLFEVGHANKLLIRGGFPRAYLASTEKESLAWRRNYIQVFLERDLLAMGFDFSPEAMRRLWMMLCAYHGQLLNVSEIAKSLMMADKTVVKYLDILAGTFMIRVLRPWFENIVKRQIKRPKIYFRDSGIYTTLSGIRDLADLSRTSKIGPLWEGFALEQIIMGLQIPAEDCYFWASHGEAELDLFAWTYGKRVGFEIKYTENIKMTKAMNIALEDLKLDHLYVIHPGRLRFPLSDKITACGLEVLGEISGSFN
jgi:predicted AAA+ superfamily ATPase